MKKKDKLSKIIDLVETALQNNDIQKDKHLCEILNKIKISSTNGEYFYDYKREFQPAISGFTIRNGFVTPKVLLELLTEIKTPKAWGGL